MVVMKKNSKFRIGDIVFITNHELSLEGVKRFKILELKPIVHELFNINYIIARIEPLNINHRLGSIPNHWIKTSYLRKDIISEFK